MRPLWVPGGMFSFMSMVKKMARHVGVFWWMDLDLAKSNPIPCRKNSCGSLWYIGSICDHILLEPILYRLKPCKIKRYKMETAISCWTCARPLTAWNSTLERQTYPGAWNSPVAAQVVWISNMVRIIWVMLAPRTPWTFCQHPASGYLTYIRITPFWNSFHVIVLWCGCLITYKFRVYTGWPRNNIYFLNNVCIP